MRVDVKQDVFKLAQVFRISRGARTEAKVLTVTVEDDQARGWGECVPYARYDETLESVEAEIRSFSGNWATLAEELPAGAARNALDCALWDHACKAKGIRIWDHLGVPMPKPEITAYTLSLDAPDAMETQARQNAHRPLLKIKLGTPDDMARLEAVRRGAPDAPIIVDANEGWTAGVYSELAPHLLRLGVKMVEQPLPASDDGMLAEIERPLPVCADESCHDRASLPALKGKYDMINIKLDKTGGLTEALALKEAAIKDGYAVMVGCMVGSSLAMAPATLLAQGVAFTDLDGPLLLAEDRDEPLLFDDHGVHPPAAALWG